MRIRWRGSRPGFLRQKARHFRRAFLCPVRSIPDCRRGGGIEAADMFSRSRFAAVAVVVISLFAVTGALRAGLPPDAESLAEDMTVMKKLTGKSREWRTASARCLADVRERLGEKSLGSGDMNRIYAGAEDYVRQQRPSQDRKSTHLNS